MELDKGQYTYENIEERIINGRLSTIIVRANRPSQTAIKRYAETMTKIINQLEERKKREYNS